MITVDSVQLVYELMFLVSLGVTFESRFVRFKLLYYIDGFNVYKLVFAALILILIHIHDINNDCVGLFGFFFKQEDSAVRRN